MAKGKDERHNPNRKVSKKEMTTFDMGGGATVQRILSPELEKDVSSMSPQEIAKYNAQEQEKYRAPAHTKIELSKLLWGE